MERDGTPVVVKWGLLSAVLSGVATSLCCALPLALAAVGVGGAWASRAALLEPYRPLLVAVTVGLLGLAFYRAYKPVKWEECSAHSTCRIAPSRRASRTALWMVAPPLLTLVAFPYVVRHLPAHVLECVGAAGRAVLPPGGDCCDVPTVQTVASTQPVRRDAHEPIDPAREIVFNVENLRCPAVKDVGCGSMLAPVLGMIDRVEGVSAGFSNWTGTRLRISGAPGADRDAIAQRVLTLLMADGRHPVRVGGKEFTQTLQSEDWYNAARLIDLSSYEFRTIAKRRLNAFADSERISAAQREKLTRLVDQLWDNSAKGLEGPGAEEGAYGQYWRSRLDRFVGAYTERARDVLTPQQVQKLLLVYRNRR